MARPRTSLSIGALGAALTLVTAAAASAAPPGAPLAPGQTLSCASERGLLTLAPDHASVTPAGASRAVDATASWSDAGGGVWDVVIETPRGQRFACAVRAGRAGWELGLGGVWSPCLVEDAEDTAPAPLDPAPPALAPAPPAPVEPPLASPLARGLSARGLAKALGAGGLTAAARGADVQLSVSGYDLALALGDGSWLLAHDELVPAGVVGVEVLNAWNASHRGARVFVEREDATDRVVFEADLTVGAGTTVADVAAFIAIAAKRLDDFVAAVLPGARPASPAGPTPPPPLAAAPPGGAASSGAPPVEVEDATTPPQSCRGEEVYGPVAVGTSVRLGKHRPVNGDENWAPAMEAEVGEITRVFELGGVDASGCPGVRVELDGGAFFWRVRDLGLVAPSSPPPAPAPARSGQAPAVITAPVAAHHVEVFGAEWCGACKLAERWLRARGVPFDEVDVDAAGGRARMDASLRAAGQDPRGFSAIPVIIVDGREVVRGFDQPALAQALAAAP